MTITYDIWLSRYAEMSGWEVNQADEGLQTAIRERWRSAGANNTAVSVINETLTDEE